MTWCPLLAVQRSLPQLAAHVRHPPLKPLLHPMFLRRLPHSTAQLACLRWMLRHSASRRKQQPERMVPRCTAAASAARWWPRSTMWWRLSR